MKSIDVFCHLMPPEYAKICMAEAPNKSHMFVRALNVASMSNMDARNEVLKAFPGYKQIPNIVSPPVETFAGPDKSPRLAAIGNDEIKKIVEANPQFYEGFIAGIPFNNVKASVEEIKRAKDMGAKGIQIYTHMNGEAIDTEKYWPIYEACEKYDLPILIHPVGGQMVPEFPKEDRSKYELWFTIGWPYQTTIYRECADVMTMKIGHSVTVAYNIMNYINHHFAEEITVDKIAAELYLNKNYIAHVFKEETGYSLIGYAIALRINRAKVLLTKTDKSITQVAAECGYDDFTYFSRQFKKSTSLTPSAYRKTHADEDEE